MGKVEDRHEKLLALLRANGTMKKEDLYEQLGIGKSLLSTDLKMLRGLGYQFDAPKRFKIVTLTGEPAAQKSLTDTSVSGSLNTAQTLSDNSSPLKNAQARSDTPRSLNTNPAPTIFETGSEFVQYTRLMKDDIRYWIILFTLREGPKTFGQIKLSFAHISDDGSLDSVTLQKMLKASRGSHVVSTDTLHRDLHRLLDNGFVRIIRRGRRTFYEHTQKCSVLYDFTKERISDFRDFYMLLSKGEASVQEFNDIFDKINVLSKGCNDIGNNISSFGKLNLISGAAKKNLFLLSQLPYKEKMIHMEYPNRYSGSLEIGCGLLFHSQETGQLYILGKKRQSRADEGSDLVILSLERILSVQESDQKNDCFQSPEIMDIYNEMFAASISGREEVCIRFDNRPYILDKLSILAESREKTASLETDSLDNTLIYKDTIRGMEDFKRYLRAFGAEYVVEKPRSLADDMAASAGRIAAMYKERFEHA